MPRLFRSVAAALVLALLLAGSAQAGPIGRRAAPPGPAFLDLLQGWLQSLRSALPDTGRLSPAWEEEGSIMDPDGRDGTAPPPPGQDAGGIMDPNG